MVDATRNHVLKCEIEDRMENHLSSKIDERFMEMAASMQQTLHDSLTQSLALSMLQQMQDFFINSLSSKWVQKTHLYITYLQNWQMNTS